MEKKNIILIAISAAIIIISLIGFFYLFNYINKKNSAILINGEKSAQTEKEKQKEAENPKTPAGETSSKFPLEIAKEKSEAVECLKIKEENDKNLCLILLAEYLQDEKICANIKDKKESGRCQERTKYEKAFQSGNLSLCASVNDSNLNYSCVANIIDKKNITNPKDCDVLPEMKKNYCVIEVSVRQDTALFQSAKEKGDCEKISNKEFKAECLTKFN